MPNSKNDRGAIALSRAVKELYSEGQTDYSMVPIVLNDSDGKPIGRILDGDAVVFCCRRGEREVELTEAFTEPGFDHFPRPDLKNLKFMDVRHLRGKFGKFFNQVSQQIALVD